jgi:hypothetical protein
MPKFSAASNMLQKSHHQVKCHARTHKQMSGILRLNYSNPKKNKIQTGREAGDRNDRNQRRLKLAVIDRSDARGSEKCLPCENQNLGN